MYIAPISSTDTISYHKLKVQKNRNSQMQLQQPSFQGEKGMLIGIGTGLVGTLLAVGVSAISGGLALPFVLGEAAIIAGGGAGGYAGHKIEEKIKEKINKNS